MAAAREDELVRGLVGGVAAFRWLAWAWMAIVLLVSRDDLDDGAAQRGVAIGLVALALLVTAVTSLLARRDPSRLLTPPMIGAELAVGFALGAADGWVFAGDHAQSLGSVWPLAGVLTAGIAWAGRGGALAGAVVGLGRLFGDLVQTRGSAPLTDLSVTASSTFVLYALAGGAAGYATVKLREAERRISSAQAREEVARTLHDGVLQTLAVVQRRAADPDLVHLAREQERDLREYLFGTEPSGGALGPRLREAAARFEDRYGGQARVVVADDLPVLPAGAVDALAGAVGEALANAGKHGEAALVTVFAEPGDDDTVFCSVKDDGRGFDPGTPEGIGLQRSVRARLAEAGGRAEVDPNPGRGTEVRLWVPT